MRASVHAAYRGAPEHWWFRARQAIFARMLDEVAGVRAGAGARILDVGPGSGINLPVLAPRGAVTVLDLDLDSA
ncbi:MAG TPA: hypothetical protein VK081_15210, partial [Planctomycetota bacterium]|nr:hypothetical protein [Planctomycetota bacterium]